jgi:hypothetical protein
MFWSCLHLATEDSDNRGIHFVSNACNLSRPVRCSWWGDTRGPHAALQQGG